jgi:superfamily II DNA helicase RecQ
MALAMHPQIFNFDAQLRSASQLLSDATEDYEDLPEDLIVVDEDLLRKLKDWRMLRAAQDEMPAYIIAHNTVLEALATRPPANLQALNGVKGFGPKKIATYGPEIIDIITNHQSVKTS